MIKVIDVDQSLIVYVDTKKVSSVEYTTSPSPKIKILYNSGKLLWYKGALADKLNIVFAEMGQTEVEDDVMLRVRRK